jgi:hypothetical protein
MLPIRAPTLRWQVPSQWFGGRSPIAQMIIWGTSLGPGIVTRNPYAGMWLVPFMLASVGGAEVGAAVGAIAGASHGLARAAGVLRNSRLGGSRAHFEIMTSQVSLRVFDGMGLLFAAGLLSSRLLQ